uniref:Uncharacterized protein n=1 Tax=Aegilops tauschii subsp. strangulata TaxID=200361 RepID=A0A452ZFW5_AEGTS
SKQSQRRGRRHRAAPRGHHGAARDRRRRAELLGDGADRRPGQYPPPALFIFLFLNPYQRLPSFLAKRHAPVRFLQDPKAVKMRRHAFHLHQSGSTTLSASAVLLPPGALADPPPLLARICASHGHAGGVALTAASLVEAFLVAEQRDSPSE